MQDFGSFHGDRKSESAIAEGAGKGSRAGSGQNASGPGEKPGQTKDKPGRVKGIPDVRVLVGNFGRVCIRKCMLDAPAKASLLHKNARCTIAEGDACATEPPRKKCPAHHHVGHILERQVPFFMRTIPQWSKARRSPCTTDSWSFLSTLAPPHAYRAAHASTSTFNAGWARAET